MPPNQNLCLFWLAIFRWDMIFTLILPRILTVYAKSERGRERETKRERHLLMDFSQNALQNNVQKETTNSCSMPRTLGVVTFYTNCLFITTNEYSKTAIYVFYITATTNPIKTKTIIMSKIHTGFTLEFGREGLVSLLARIWELLSNNMVSLKMVMQRYLKKGLVEF